MEIKTAEGSHSVTGIGQGTYNTIAGSIGLAGALGLFSGNGINLFGNRNNTEYVTKAEFDLQREISYKDSEIALLKSEQNTENKITDVYERIMTRVNANERAQQEVNAAQAVYNATANSTIAVLQNQVAGLVSLTKVIVPSTSICPQPMPLYNSWTAPTTPTSAS